jgi:hypothetical protein
MRTLGRSIHRFVPLVAGTLLLGCDAPTPPGAAPAAGVALFSTGGVSASATGGGHYLLQGALDVQFAFSAIQNANGEVTGHFHHTLDAGGGETIDFSGRVTCLAFDAEKNRAWIGGVITENRSTATGWTPDIEIFQPGHDVWFRVVDYGENVDATQPDRTTFMGFENTPGIPTSAFYCALKPWPDLPVVDARTWPVTEGNIQVRVEAPISPT